MTAKEKAVQLFNKYSDFFTIWDVEKDIAILHESAIDDVIKCALIAVDEVLDHQVYLDDNYWQDVKTEIQKL